MHWRAGASAECRPALWINDDEETFKQVGDTVSCAARLHREGSQQCGCASDDVTTTSRQTLSSSEETKKMHPSAAKACQGSTREHIASSPSLGISEPVEFLASWDSPLLLAPCVAKEHRRREEEGVLVQSPRVQATFVVTALQGMMAGRQVLLLPDVAFPLQLQSGFIGL